MLRARVDEAARRGLSYIAAKQLAGGGFESYSSPTLKPFSVGASYRTVFVPALILSALARADDPASISIRDRTAGFLRGQARSSWSFNYWVKRSPERRSKPYPDDLDDTFCALAGLYLHDSASVDGEVLAKAIKLLLATESEPGGPYRTWLVPADSKAVWLDIDVAVNANVAYFLHLIGSPLPKLGRFLDDAVKRQTVSSPYYPSAHMPAYYIARGYEGNQKPALTSMLRGLLRSSDDALQLALCISSLAELGGAAGLDGPLDTLLAMQGSDGAWPAAAFCMDPAMEGKTYYNGAPALTTAFAVEALALYIRVDKASSDKRVSQARDPQKAILDLASSRCQDLDRELGEPLLRALDKLARGDNGREIMGLAKDSNASLLKPVPKARRLAEELGAANLCGWLAYGIYDGLLDGHGRPDLLPVASTAMRRSFDGFRRALPDNRGFARLIEQVFDTIDAANAWEQAECRAKVSSDSIHIDSLPDYSDMSKLAERSFGHALPVLGVVVASGVGLKDRPFSHAVQAMKHYLIARQLNDDAHDWPDDLAGGRMTPVVSRLLADIGAVAGKYDLAKLAQDARRQFWYDSLPDICRLMRLHVAKSRLELKKSGLFKPADPISKLLDGIDASITDTLGQQEQAVDFLKHYGRKTGKVKA